MSTALKSSIPVRPLKMSREDLIAVLNALDEPAPEPTSGAISQRRKTDRETCRRHGVVIRVQSNGPAQHYAVHLRNVSNEGAAFLHGGMLHRETPCILLVLQSDGSLLRSAGKVARCRHVSGMVYEIGIRFDRPIDAARLSIQSPAQSGAAPTTNTEPCT